MAYTLAFLLKQIAEITEGLDPASVMVEIKAATGMYSSINNDASPDLDLTTVKTQETTSRKLTIKPIIIHASRD